VILDASNPWTPLYVILDGSVRAAGERRMIVDTADIMPWLGAWALFRLDDPIPAETCARDSGHASHAHRRDDF